MPPLPSPLAPSATSQSGMLGRVASADVIFALDRGRIVQRGAHSELLARGGLYADLHQQQFAGGLVEARCDDGIVLSSGDVVELPATAVGGE